MPRIEQAASEFLASRRVAVTGVSRAPKGHGSNVVYQRLRDRGYEVFAVNPNADEVEGDRCYHDLRSIPGGVEAVVIGTRPERAEETIRECAELGIRHVWMHRGPGAGSVSEPAADYGRLHGMEVIDGGCPCMFGPTADFGHRIMRRLSPSTATSPGGSDRGSGRDRDRPLRGQPDRGCREPGAGRLRARRGGAGRPRGPGRAPGHCGRM